MKNLNRLFLFIGFALCFSSCESLEKTDLVRSETIMNVGDKTLLYQMHLTGTDKYRYNFMLAGAQDTTQLFETRFNDETANNVGIEIGQTRKHITITLDKQIEKQTKTVEGVTFQLEGTK